jgi:bifunctional DNase/RNase
MRSSVVLPGFACSASERDHGGSDRGGIGDGAAASPTVPSMKARTSVALAIDMSKQTEQRIPMHVAELRRTKTSEPGVERHILFLEDDRGRRLPIWIGPAEATAMALILEQVQLPRPGVYQFAASLLAGAGGRLREVRVTELTESTFYAQAILTDDTSVDARPSDALTLALVTDAPIYVAAGVLKQAEATTADRSELIEEANAAVDDAA